MTFGRHIAMASRQRTASRSLSFRGFPLGLNTSVPEFEIDDKELAECINFKLNRGGQLQTRDAINRYTTTPISGNPAIKYIQKAPIGSSNYELVIDADYKIYYVSGNTFTQIGSQALEGETTLFPYKGVVIVLDGSYIKYLDGVSAVKIAYDDGTGTNGYQFNNKSGSVDSSLPIGDGTNSRVAYKFTSQAWDSGYTIPPTTVTAKLNRVGDGYTGTDNVDITVAIRKVSDDSTIATKTLVAAPIKTNLSATATEYSATFAASDISSEMSPSTAYYCSIEYNNGDGTNHVDVWNTTVSSGGAAFYYTTTWTADATKDPVISLRPGRPPKGKFGVVYGGRPFVGGDPDNPGYIWFGNSTYLDWSTADGGGYVGLVDSDANNFPAGGLAVLYNDLYVYGKQDQPCLAKLTGSTPSSYSLPLLFQQVWTTHKTLVGTGNDLWAAAIDGVYPLTGVQEYGDLRTFVASNPVDDRIKDYWSTANSFAQYYSKDGQYWLVNPSYHRVLVCHIKMPKRNYSTGENRYPWVEYEFYRDIFTSSTYKWTASSNGTNEYYVELAAGGDPSIAVQPDALTLDNTLISEGIAGSLEDHEWDYGDNDSLGYNTVYIRDDSGDPDTSGVVIRSVLIPQAMAAYNGNLYMGGSDGHLYYFDTSIYKDIASHQIDPMIKGKYFELPYRNVNLEKYQFIAHSKGGAGCTVNIYRNNRTASPAASYTHDLPLSDSLTLADMDMVLGDADFTLSSKQYPLWKRINLNAYSFQLELKNILLAGYPLYINGFLFQYRPLEL